MLFHIMFWIKYQLMSLGIGKERGQGLIEYALIIVLIAGIIVAAVVLLGGQIENFINEVGSQLINEVP